MTHLFSKLVINNYGQGGQIEIGGVWNILDNPNVLRFMGGGSENVLGYF